MKILSLDILWLHSSKGEIGKSNLLKWKVEMSEWFTLVVEMVLDKLGSKHSDIHSDI